MIKSINLKNFKTFKEIDELKFAPLTIILGSNSSGKSTILQEILILKQTLDSPTTDETILLNGANVSLGEFNDVINESAKSENKIELGIEFGEKTESTEDGFVSAPEALNVKITACITEPQKEKKKGNLPDLLSVKIAGGTGEDNFELSFVQGKNVLSELEETYDIDKVQLFGSKELYTMQPNNNTHGESKAVLLNKFLPEKVFFEHHKKLIDEQNNFINEFSELLKKSFGFGKINSSFIILKLRFDKIKHSLEFLAENIGKYDVVPDNGESGKIDNAIHLIECILEDHSLLITYRNNFKQIFERINKDDFALLSEMLESYFQKISEAKNQKKTLISRGLSELDLEENVELYQLCAFIKDCFKSIYYLGPIREEPKSFYNRSTSNDPLYVGQKGENTASVLAYYSDKEISCVCPPESGSEWNPLTADISKCSLNEAVLSWVRYIGIAQEVKAQEMGKMGLALKANISGNNIADLPNVGVGVSQVLPLIVMGLVSPENAVLIFEQPELHLHPYVQSRLADFFMALNRLGKQVIVETHSEHLILRARYYVAKGDLDHKKGAAIYFTQRKYKGEFSEITRVKLDRYGAIDEWPDGFEDETDKLLTQILKASFKRKD